MAQLIDTSVLVTMERRGLPVDSLIEFAPDELSGLSAVSVSELLVGVHRADTDDHRRHRDEFVQSVLEAFPVFPFDLVVARMHAELWAELAAGGAMIGAHDLQIAATALAHGYAVLTDDVRDFGRVPGLEVRRPGW